MNELRSTSQRKSDVIAELERNSTGWLATASADARPHLIAASTTWTGSEVLIATRLGSATAKNVRAARAAKLALGSTDDVVLLDLELVEMVPATAQAGEIAARFKSAQGWDPADEGPDWAYFRFRPVRIQAYRGYGEIEGRDVMRDGRWLA